MSNPWRKTRVANLLRHTSGRYYARYTIGGKTTFEALKTDVFEVAKLRLSERLSHVEKSRTASKAVRDGTGRIGELMTLYENRVNARVDIKAGTRKRHLEGVAYLRKTWPGVETLKPAAITKGAIIDWRNHALANGTGFKPPGAKSVSENVSGKSPSSFNKALDTLRALLEIAVERGAIAVVPLPRRGLKAKVTPYKPVLPDRKTLLAIFDEVENGSAKGRAARTGRGREIADFVRAIAFTGCRLAELGALRWQDLDFERGIIRVAGTKTETSLREVPLIPNARALFERVLERRKKAATIAIDGDPYLNPASRVFIVSEAQKSLTRACEKLEVNRLTHHDLRDAFATTCIEAGVDVPTVAAWLGHADGGALLMRVYAHHRRAHSLEQANKVSFGG
ncbi:MAG: tyrosine-type recombinase/integrase [Opitutaceae bacterium]